MYICTCAFCALKSGAVVGFKCEVHNSVVYIDGAWVF